MSHSDAASDRTGVQVIARAAALLRALEDEPMGLSLGELAIRLNLARSTVQRIARALSDEQMLMPASQKSRIKLGPLLMRLGAGVRLDVAAMARPFLQELSRQLDETVDLSVLNGNVALFIDQVVGPQRLAAVSSVGERFPLHSTANGKALLSSLTPHRRAALLKPPLGQDTPATTTSIEALNLELQTVIQTGLAFDHEEHTVGVSAIGTWFVDPSGRAFALSVPVPTLRLKDPDPIAVALLRTRDDIMRQFGSV